MSVPLWIVLLAVTWTLVLLGCRKEARYGSPFGSGLGELVYFGLGVIVTLVVLLVREWGWL